MDYNTGSGILERHDTKCIQNFLSVLMWEKQSKAHLANEIRAAYCSKQRRRSLVVDAVFKHQHTNHLQNTARLAKASSFNKLSVYSKTQKMYSQEPELEPENMDWFAAG